MNDLTNRELMKAVERVVRPVTASLARKRRMREELMAHVSALLEEEARLPGGEEEAVRRAARRLGDPAELSAQLEQTVPARDLYARFNEKWWTYHVGETALRRAVRIGVAMFALFWIELSGLFPLSTWLKGLPSQPLLMFVTAMIVAVSIAVLTFVFILLEHAMRQAVCSSTHRSAKFAVLVGAAGFATVPVTAFVLQLALTGDPVFGRIAGVSLFAPLVLYVAAGPIAKEIRYQEEWASLDVSS
jgi:hypothetical protein